MLRSRPHRQRHRVLAQARPAMALGARVHIVLAAKKDAPLAHQVRGRLLAARMERGAALEGEVQHTLHGSGMRRHGTDIDDAAGDDQPPNHGRGETRDDQCSDGDGDGACAAEHRHVHPLWRSFDVCRKRPDREDVPTRGPRSRWEDFETVGQVARRSGDPEEPARREADATQPRGGRGVLAVPEGLEPSTCRLEVGCSIQLSYGTARLPK